MEQAIRAAIRRHRGSLARAAVVAGLRAGRAVVTAAAIIMISVLGGFIFSRRGRTPPSRAEPEPEPARIP